MDELKGLHLCIAPKTAMSMAFKRYLDTHLSYTFVCYIDQAKTDDDVVRIEVLKQEACDSIIILSPNHDQFIYQKYLQYFPCEKLYVVSIQDQRYHFTQNVITPDANGIEGRSKALDQVHASRQGIAFISKGFIGSNNKYLYLDFIRNALSCIMISDNRKQLDELSRFSLPYALLDSPEGDEAIASAKILIFDQGNYTHFYISPQQTTIQLWHGVGLKKMAPHRHITYDYFVSTSQWTNETNFHHIFNARHFLDYGYPRNAFLLESKETPKDLLFCDQDLFKAVKSERYNKIVLYMPTTREYLFGTEASLENLLPLRLDELNTQLATINVLMIIKLHPFIIEFFQKSHSTNNFSHIVFHSPDGDIYPILKYTDILVSDYSSIVYDFLLLNRPIIFFDYDRKRYEENMGGFLFDYDVYSPGEKVSTQEELINVIAQSQDTFSLYREHIKSFFFTSRPTNTLLRKLVQDNTSTTQKL